MDAANVPSTEIAALQDLFSSTNGNSWTWPDTGNHWNFTNPNPCLDTWQGINCSTTPLDGYLHVLQVKLDKFGLVGCLPASLEQLTQLTVLQLESNHLSGTIPDSLGQLSELTILDLYKNTLGGSVPSSLGQLSRLSVLRISHNHLMGGIPKSLGQLTSLTQLLLDDNKLTGTIPSSLGSLTMLTELWLDGNYLNGTMPESLGQLTQLSQLVVATNYLTGTLPKFLAQLTHLTVLNVEENSLTGTIPDFLGQLTQLRALDLGHNDLSSTVPSSLGELGQLRSLYLSRSKLTGTVPEALGQLTQLQTLNMDGNKHSGTVPRSFAKLGRLKLLDFGTNNLAGALPSFLGQLTQLAVLYLDANDFTGTIPQTLSALGDSLGLLHLQRNRLSGAIPEALGHLPVLLSLNLSTNCLTGTIPASFRQLTSLQVLMLHNNQLRGGISEMFSASQTNLSTVQLSGNQLTGTLPASAFVLPALKSFVVVDNCFTGPLPYKSICHSAVLSALVLDGFHSASACKRHTSLLRKPFHLGSLPTCLLSMPNLVTLHLSGSALTGSLPAAVNTSTVLVDLSLSHNLLTGEIPTSILERDWDKLDLSFNRFTGTLYRARAAPYGNATKLYLQHNRLSGVIPASMQRVHSLTILENNMFSCRVDRSDVPQQEPDHGKYTCGSDSVNNSLYAWLGAVVVIAALVAVFVWAVSDRRLRVVDWFNVCSARLPSLQSVFRTADALTMLGAGCAAYSLAVLLPVYAAVNAYHPSFTDKYAWTVSGVFLTGTTAFAVEATFLIVQLPCCGYAVTRLLSGTDSTKQDKEVLQTLPPSANTSSDHKQKFLAKCAVWLLSFAVVTGINIGFVAATLHVNGKALTAIQILLAVFKLGFNNIVAPALQNRAGTLNRGSEVPLTRLLWVLLNVIVIPCLVVMAISPACFSDLLKGTGSVTSHYSYGADCVHLSYSKDNGTVSGVSCDEFESVQGFTTYKPDFTYSYQCSSSFVTYYAPTFVIMCIISGFVVPGYHLLLMLLRRKLSPIYRLYSVVTAVTPRILRELPSPQDLAQARSDPLYRPAFNVTQLTVSLLTYLALLLTFGALFPPLAVCCAVTMGLVVLTARLEVGRYVSAAVAADRQDCLDEVESACAGVAVPDRLRVGLHLVLAMSCVFYTLFLFDTLGDKVGFAGAFWVLIVVPLLPVMPLAVHMAENLRSKGPTENLAPASSADPEGGVALADRLSGTITEDAKGRSEWGDSTSENPLHAP
jgi:Leucine-rich repeat (LRR) protein